MTEDKNDMIPADSGKKLPELLEKHLRGIIPEKDLHQFGEQLPAEFLSDASEGLHQIGDSQQLESVLNQLNQQMHHQLTHKKIHQRRSFIWDLTWTYWAIIVIFLLTITGFFVIRMYINR
jgi:hypothetical protein